MVRELNMDTQRQNFWKESVEKEAMVRLMWHTRYSKEFSRSTFVPKPRKEGMTIKSAGAIKLPALKDKEQKTTKTDIQQASKQKFGETAKDNPDALLVEMRPVSTNTKSVLYKGFSALGEGRYAYLQKRKLKKPEEKYEFPITSAWEVGWKINEYIPAIDKNAQFGRTHVIRDSFYRPNGIFYH